MFFDILLSGGIGNKLLRLIAGCGEAIIKGIEPSEIRIIDQHYSAGELNHTGNSTEYHNRESIFNYVETNIGTYMKTIKKVRVKKYNFDQKMVKFMLAFFASQEKSEYIRLKDFHRNNALRQFHHVLWIRGKDRPSNLNAFMDIVSAIKVSEDISILSNDSVFIRSNKELSKYYASSSSFDDFCVILNSKIIYTQMSGFALAPYILSPKSQSFVLLDKEYHCPIEYAYLEKDWKFYILLLRGISKIQENKQFAIAKMNK